MNELIKPSCVEPLLLLSKRGLKAIDDGGICVDFPRPPSSAYSGEYSKLLWHLFYKGWNLEVIYRGFTIPLFQYVPCGKCELCQQSRRIDIIRRAELASSEYTCPPYQFKLTYDDAHLPKYSELQYRDVQLFFKRLRKRCTTLKLPTDFKYIVAGEYGSHNTHRPHYHVILFNNPLRCSEFEPDKQKFLKRLLWDAWRNDTWFVFNQPKNVTQCYGSIATYCTKYIGKHSPQEDVFISEAGRTKHRCFVRCSSKLGRGVMSPVVDEYRSGYSNQFEYFSSLDGEVKSHYMSKTELRYLHPTPLDMLPSKVKDAWYSLKYSLGCAVDAGIMSKYDAVKLAESVKINVQHPPLIVCDERVHQLRSSDYFQVSDFGFDFKSAIIQAIKEDCAILSEFGHIPLSVIDNYLRFKSNPVHDGSDYAAKLFKIRKDNAVIIDKTTD